MGNCAGKDGCSGTSVVNSVNEIGRELTSSTHRLTSSRHRLTSSRHKHTSLGSGLVWIQERDITGRYDILKTVGRGSIGEVSIVKRRASITPCQSANNFQDPQFLDLAGMESPRRVPQSSFNSTGSTGSSADLNTTADSGMTAKSTGGRAHRKYAMKTVYVTRMNKEMIREFDNEVSILQKLHHPNIISLREVFYYQRKVYMLMDLCEGGQLNQRTFSEAEVCTITTQICQALVYLHDRAGICHRDLKLENIMLLHADPSAPLVVKLIDFGLSQVFMKGEKLRKACGTVYACAPEVALGAGYTQKADLWSVGIIVFYLLSGDFPFLRDEEDLNNKAMMDRFTAGKFFFTNPIWYSAVTKDARSLIGNLLKKTSTTRWSAKEAADYCTGVWAKALAASNEEAEGRGGAGEEEVQPPGEPSAMKSVARSMERFANYGELRKAALMITAFHMDKGELHNLTEAFKTIDDSGDGVITYQELEKVLTEYSAVDSDEISRIFRSIDHSNQGLIDYMEFLAASIEARGFIEEELLEQAFERLDVDSSGYITRSNLQAVMGSSVDKPVLDKMMREGDPSATGKIAYQEFLNLMHIVREDEIKEEEDIFEDEKSHASMSACGLLPPGESMTYRELRKASDISIMLSERAEAASLSERAR
ncbi:unnamed protein product [Chrysoparadoxa australica]